MKYVLLILVLVFSHSTVWAGECSWQNKWFVCTNPDQVQKYSFPDWVDVDTVRYWFITQEKATNETYVRNIEVNCAEKSYKFLDVQHTGPSPYGVNFEDIRKSIVGSVRYYVPGSFQESACRLGGLMENWRNEVAEKQAQEANKIKSLVPVGAKSKVQTTKKSLN
jgi:hypothetical protein